MSIGEHIAAGRKMQTAYIETLRLSDHFVNTYGRRNITARHLSKAYRVLLDAKSAANDLFFAENINAQHSPYFGKYYLGIK